MKLFPSRRALLASVTGAALVAATGGFALASAAPQSGVVHLCVDQATGVLRLSAHCRPGEEQLILNQRGPAGPRGKPGKVGKNGTNGFNGPPGLRGPSDAWNVSGTQGNTSNDPSNNIPSASPDTLATDTLPGGNFVAYATVDLETSLDPTSTGPVNTFCTLSAGSFSYTDRLQLPQPTTGSDNPAQEAPVAMDIAGQLSPGTTIALNCQRAPGTYSTVPVHFTMTAIEVGALH